MKRIFLIVPLLFLAACGLKAIPDEGLTNAVIYNEGVAALFENYELTEVTVNKVWTDMRPLSNSNQASVTYRLELAEDLLQSGGDGPFYLYGSGVLQVKDDAFTFAAETAVQGQSEKPVQMQIWLPSGDTNAPIYGLPMELTAQIDGFTAISKDSLITGLAVWPGQEPAILTSNENATELSTFQCQGRMVPNSSQALVTFTAETAAGQTITGAGLLETGKIASAEDNHAELECSMEGKGQVTHDPVFEFGNGFKGSDEELQAFQPATVSGHNIHIPSLRLRSNGNGQQIMFETFMTAVAQTD
jgi:hypothetical protein